MNRDTTPPTIRGALLVPALICAVACIVLMRTGFLAFFFLVPLGFCSAAFGPVAAWCGFVIAALGNALVSAGFSLQSGVGLIPAAWGAAYFAVLALGFTWMMAGNPRQSVPRIRTMFRFFAAVAAAALTFLVMALALGREEGFTALLHSYVEGITSLYLAAPGIDAAQQTFLERALTPDRVIEALSSIALRGGMLASLSFLLFFSRQVSLLLARLLRRQRETTADLIGFHAPRRAIWALTLCLLAIVAFRATSFEIGEIAAWNVLIVCAIMYLAQGGGIVLFTLARRSMPPFVRLGGGIVLIFLALNPGLYMVALGSLVLLGIAENWLPLRVIKQPAA